MSHAASELVAQKTAAKKGQGHRRRASPSYVVHLQKCRQRGELLHTAVSEHESDGTLQECDETSSSMSLRRDNTLSPDVSTLEMDFQQNFRITSEEDFAGNGNFRSRTQSASSRASVDSIRGGHTGGHSAGATPEMGALPLSTFEIYELSRYLDPSDTCTNIPARNPNKILLTIDLCTSLIVAANSIATSIFGYQQQELQGMTFQQLLTTDNYLEDMALNEDHCSMDGSNLNISEKLYIAVEKTGIKFPVSMWMKLLPSDHRRHCLAVMEPVERTTGILTATMLGRIVDADPQLAPVFGFHSNPSDLLESSLQELFPKLQLPQRKGSVMPKNLKHQHVLGHVENGQKLPLTVLMRFSGETDPVTFSGARFPTDHSALEYESDIECIVMLYHNVTGLMTLGKDGKISSCDSSFCTLLFGYSPGELESKHINDLIPGLLSEVNALGVKLRTFSTLPYHLNSNNASRCSTCGTSGSAADTTVVFTGDDSLPSSAASAELHVILENENNTFVLSDFDADAQRNDIFLSQQNSLDVCDSPTSLRSPTPEPVIKPPRASSKKSRHVRSGASTASKRNLQSGDIMSNSSAAATGTGDLPLLDSPDTEGLVAMLSINTNALHKDDFEININVKIKFIQFEDGVARLCLWVKRTDGGSRMDSDLSTTFVDGFPVDHNEELVEYNSATDAFKGLYAETYTTLKTVGKGAFGDVKLGAHVLTGAPVIVKCIDKKEVLTCSWKSLSEEEIDTLNITREANCMSRKDSVPMELYLLRTLCHPNIVSLVDVFETDRFYQLVMPKHGKGMDLFSFIDLEPAVDEPLACHMFSQVVDAVDYLHQRNIIHRDIKDENIILDENFQVKLIDFGSAALMMEGKLFDSFCGTIEYCAPEVLLGNRYQGPELEMWTLGVTLYTLVFFENPFRDADEVIGGHLEPPFCVSAALTQVMLWLLHPDPQSRCTITKLRECSWMKQKVDCSKYNFMRVLAGQVPTVPDNLKQRMDSAKMKRKLSQEVLRVSCKSH